MAVPRVGFVELSLWDKSNGNITGRVPWDRSYHNRRPIEDDALSVFTVQTVQVLVLETLFLPLHAILIEEREGTGSGSEHDTFTPIHLKSAHDRWMNPYPRELNLLLG